MKSCSKRCSFAKSPSAEIIHFLCSFSISFFWNNIFFSHATSKKSVYFFTELLCLNNIYLPIQKLYKFHKEWALEAAAAAVKHPLLLILLASKLSAASWVKQTQSDSLNFQESKKEEHFTHKVRIESNSK